MLLQKAFHISCILVYLVFSQFVIKALVTTDHANAWWESFCMSKNLKSLDSKQNCRESKNIANFWDIFDPTKFLVYIQNTLVPTENLENLFVDTLSTIRFYAHAPPDRWEHNILSYVQRYVWIILLLI